jgi:hypothetical protein
MFTINPQTQKNSVGKSANYGAYIRFTDVDYTFGSWKAVKASASYTLSTLPTDGQTLTINGKVYTFKTNITTSDGDVKIGTLIQTQANLVGAINGDNATVSIGYGANTRPNTIVTITDFTANVATIRAIKSGILPNLYTLTATVGTLSSSTLIGGAIETVSDTIMIPNNMISNSGSFDFYNQLSSFSQRYAADTSLYSNNQSRRFFIPQTSSAQYKAFTATSVYTNLKTNKISAQSIIPQNSAYSMRPIQSIGISSSSYLVYMGNNNLLQIQTIANDGSISYGTAFTHTNNIEVAIVVNTTKIIGMRWVNANTVEFMYFTVSGTTISFTSATQVTGLSNNVGNTYGEGVQVNTDKAVFSFINNSSTGTRSMCAVDVSGALTIGILSTYTPFVYQNVPRMLKYDTDKLCIINGASSIITSQVIAVTVSGTSLAVGSSYAPNVIIDGANGLTVSDRLDAIAINTSNVIFSGQNPITGLYGVEQISISGTTISSVKVIDIQGSPQYSVRMINYDTNLVGLYVDAYMYQIDITAGNVKNLNIAYSTLFTYSQAISQRTTTKVGIYTVKYTNFDIEIFSTSNVVFSNHQTPMLTLISKIPFAYNPVSFVGNVLAKINEDNAYFQILNQDGQPRKIQLLGLVVETGN